MDGARNATTLPCRHDDVEICLDTAGRQIEFGEIADKPRRSGVVFFCGSDENRVDIDSDNHMPDVVQITAESARPAPCIENPATASEHRVDQTCFPDNVLAVRSHGTETLDISCGMRRVGCSDLFPLAGDALVRGVCSHLSRVPTAHRVPTTVPSAAYPTRVGRGDVSDRGIHP